MSHPVLRGPLSNLGLSAALSLFVVDPTHFRPKIAWDHCGGGLAARPENRKPAAARGITPSDVYTWMEDGKRSHQNTTEATACGWVEIRNVYRGWGEVKNGSFTCTHR